MGPHTSIPHKARRAQWGQGFRFLRQPALLFGTVFGIFMGDAATAYASPRSTSESALQARADTIPEEGAPGSEPPDNTVEPDTSAIEPSLAAYRELCRLQSESEAMVEEAQRLLQETSCAAALWFDGLFGDDRDLVSARRTSGQIALSTQYSEAGGVDPDGRLRLRYSLPNLERRISVFLDRDSEENALEDRRERFPVRSSFASGAHERWMAGLGITPPGSLGGRVDFRVGVRPSSAPTVFAQIRTRQHLPVGDWVEWHLRQAVFWENRAGFGVTTGVEYQHVLPPNHLLHWGATGTLSEASEGVEWRSEGTLYRRLGEMRTVGGQLFARGATSRAVPLVDYGVRALYRRPLGQPTLIGEFVVGYSWPRVDVTAPREGSFIVGAGLELSF